MRVVLVPLDERPVNVRDPRLVGGLAGAEVVVPPARLLGSFRTPGDTAGLAAWLRDAAPGADGLVVALDQLCHGGLLASRLTGEPAWVPAARLAVLAELRAADPLLPILAFATVTRAPDADEATEEPAYWARHGRALHALFGLLARAEAGEPVAAQAAAARAALPADVVADALRRRLRNHQVTLAALGQVAEGVVDLLVCGVDDTAVASLAGGERRWIASWAARLALGDRVLVSPGADEVGSVLVARLAAQAAGRRPRVALRCAPAGGLERVAPYEDGPVGRTAAGHVRAVGATLVDLDDAPDLVLAIHPPAGTPGDWAVGPRPAPGDVGGLAAGLDADAARGVPVALADVAFPNGADPAVVDLLRRRGRAGAPLSYAAWNTAGNSIGSALAAAVARLAAGPGADPGAAHRLLVARLVQDAGYMTAVRRPSPSHVVADGPLGTPVAAPGVEAALGRWLAELGDLADGVALVPGSVRLPWGRAFEVDLAGAARA